MLAFAILFVSTFIVIFPSSHLLRYCDSEKKNGMEGWNNGRGEFFFCDVDVRFDYRHFDIVVADGA